MQIFELVAKQTRVEFDNNKPVRRVWIDIEGTFHKMVPGTAEDMKKHLPPKFPVLWRVDGQKIVLYPAAPFPVTIKVELEDGDA